MVIMAESFSADGYDVLGELSLFENTNRFLSERVKGVQLSCWGRPGHRLPRLPEIFVPSHVIIYDARNEEPDPAFQKLSEYRGAEQSFSLYDEATFDEQNNLDGSDQDEIYHSDSDCSSKNEDGDSECSACGGSNEKVINSLPCEDKINKIDYLNSNHFENSKLPNLKVIDDNHLVDEPWGLNMKLQNEISFVVEREGDDRAGSMRPNQMHMAESDSFPIANYALGKKSEDKILFSPKKKQVKAKKRVQNKTKQGQMMLSDLASDETECEQKEDIDDLRLYYQNFGSYHASNVPTVCKSEFPELLQSPQRGIQRAGSETEKSSSEKEQEKLDFRSITKSFMPVPQYENPESNEHDEWPQKNVQDLLIIKNLPFGLSKDNLKSYLEDFGTVQDLILEADGANITATAMMDCDLDWVIEALDGNSLEVDSDRRLICYKIKGNE